VTESIDCIVVGAGVVGLACARTLALAGRDVIVLEAGPSIGWETSSRNSEVVHSGIYYSAGSRKATACVEGRRKLYDYCAARSVPYAKLGKLIVATNEAEEVEIHALWKRGRANGVDDLELIDQSGVAHREPELTTRGALWSPSTGIIDSHALMLSLQGELEDAGAMIVFKTPVTGGHIEADGIYITTGGDAPMTLSSRLVINAGGLHAQEFARSLDGFEKSYIPPRHLARGVYFSLSGRSPFSHLIYPAPESGGLGVHATLDLAGQCRFGPDVEWVDSIDYTVAPERGDVFYERIRRYWPGLKNGALTPSYAGIRPKIVGPDEAAGDFVIQGPETHGCGPLINLFGIESPGLTSSLALADEVAKLAQQV